MRKLYEKFFIRRVPHKKFLQSVKPFMSNKRDENEMENQKISEA